MGWRSRYGFRMVGKQTILVFDQDRSREKWEVSGLLGEPSPGFRAVLDTSQLELLRGSEA